jgi:hypothetical protein
MPPQAKGLLVCSLFLTLLRVGKSCIVEVRRWLQKQYWACILPSFAGPAQQPCRGQAPRSKSKQEQQAPELG